MSKQKFDKDFLPLRPTQSDTPFTRNPRVKKSLSWRRRDGALDFLKKLRATQEKIKDINDKADDSDDDALGAIRS